MKKYPSFNVTLEEFTNFDFEPELKRMIVNQLVDKYPNYFARTQTKAFDYDMATVIRILENFRNRFKRYFNIWICHTFTIRDYTIL